jgi:hypothetical protein
MVVDPSCTLIVGVALADEQNMPSNAPVLLDTVVVAVKLM